MRRRPQEEEHDNHERWLVSYADFITLLFAFFVVMYAISQVNEGKYRVLSDTLAAAFRSLPGHAPPTPSAAIALAPESGQPAVTLPMRDPPPAVKTDEAMRAKREKLRHVAQDINRALSPLVQTGKVRVIESALGVTVEINASVLFAPGESRLDMTAVRALAAVAEILAPTDFPIVVEGHTDNVPINTPQFPSNWELSGVRASSVVRLFIDNGVDARRLSAVGYADQRPVEDNATAEGRARNRRVAITIEARTPDKAVEVAMP